MKLLAAGRGAIARRLAIAAVPVAAAAALLGPAAGTASALPISGATCESIRVQVYDDWDNSDAWAHESSEAFLSGNFLASETDSIYADQWKQKGDDLYDSYTDLCY
jgi:hypothetical protein